MCHLGARVSWPTRSLSPAPGRSPPVGVSPRRFRPGDHGTYPEAERERVLGDLRARYGRGVDLLRGYGLAHTELQQTGKDEPLNIANENIGFYRNMTVACLASAGVVVGYALVGRDALAPVAWVPIFLAATFVFAARYRRFWRRFGDYVIRGFRVLPPRTPELP